MWGRDERRGRLQMVVELYAGSEGVDLDVGWAEEMMPPLWGADEGLLDADDELVVAEVREALLRILTAGRAGTPDPDPPITAIAGLLGGTEMILRSELIVGNGERLPQLIPSFTYLVSLFFLSQKEALRLSRLAAQMLDR
jgi:hypothetical protein